MAAGDADAASAFVGRFQRRVYGLALTITGEARTAEDVAQEALLRAWRHAAAYDPRRGSVATWLLTITRNVAIDMVRVRRPGGRRPRELLASAARAPGARTARASIGGRGRGAARTAPCRPAGGAAAGGRAGRSATG